MYGLGTTIAPVTPKLPERPTFPKSKDMAFIYHWAAESYGICLVGLIMFLLCSELGIMKHASIPLCKHYSKKLSEYLPLTSTVLCEHALDVKVVEINSYNMLAKM